MRRFRLTVAFVLAFFVAAAPAQAALPGDPPPPPLQGLTVGDPPTVSAKAWLLYDDTLEFELAGLNEDQRLPIASTTKIMTALLAIENSEPGEIVQVSEAAAAIGEAEIGLLPGETFSIDELIKVMLIRSANDAAMAIAEHIGGSVAEFVEMMNRRAQELGLADTHFRNPHGLDAPDHYSSARDLLRLTLTAMDLPAFAEWVATAEYKLPDAPDGATRVAKTTNHLLRDGFEGMLGVKTGFTLDAGLTFVAAAERTDRRLFAVVLGSEGASAHFSDASALLEWGFAEFRLVQVFVEGTTYGQYRGGFGVEPLIAGESSQVLLTRRSEVSEVLLEPRFEAEAPVMVATLDEAELARVPLTLGTERHMPSLSDALGWIVRYWEWLWHG